MLSEAGVQAAVDWQQCVVRGSGGLGGGCMYETSCVYTLPGLPSPFRPLARVVPCPLLSGAAAASQLLAKTAQLTKTDLEMDDEEIKQIIVRSAPHAPSGRVAY